MYSVEDAVKLMESSRDAEGSLSLSEWYDGMTTVRPFVDFDNKVPTAPSFEEIKEWEDNIKGGWDDKWVWATCHRPLKAGAFKMSIRGYMPDYKTTIPDLYAIMSDLNDRLTGGLNVDTSVYAHGQRVIRMPYMVKPGERGVDAMLKPEDTGRPLADFLITAPSEDAEWLRADQELLDKYPFVNNRVFTDVELEQDEPIEDLNQLRDLLACIHGPLYGAYDHWASVVGRIKSVAGGSDAGCVLADQWSRTVPNYEEGVVRKKYRSFNKPVPVSAAFFSLQASARDSDPEAYREWRAKYVDRPMTEYAFTDDPEVVRFDLFDGEVRDYQTVKSVFELNHFFLKREGAYVTEEEDGKITVKTKAEFTTTYENIRIANPNNKGPKTVAFINQWYIDPLKRSFKYKAFLPPPLVTPANVYNTFRGLRAQRVLERLGVEEAALGSPDMFLDMVRVAAGVEEGCADYLEKWIARLVQMPGARMEVMPAIVGKQGIGKSKLFEEFGAAILGEEYVMQTANVEDIVGTHAEMDTKLLLMFEEASGKDTFAHRDKLFNAISAKNVRVNPKYQRPYDSPNLTKYVATTNSDRPFPAGRRFWPTVASDENQGNFAVFGAFEDYMKDDRNAAAIYNYLMNVDLTGWVYQKPPTTSLMLEIAANAISLEGQFLERILIEMNGHGRTSWTLPASEVIVMFVKMFKAKPNDDAAAINRLALSERNNFRGRLDREHKAAFDMGAVEFKEGRTCNQYTFDAEKLKAYLESLGRTLEGDEFQHYAFDD
jgi:hypothetical protein